MGAPPSHDGTMVAIFGTTRRQLGWGSLRSSSAGPSSQRDRPSFCWSPADGPTTNDGLLRPGVDAQELTDREKYLGSRPRRLLRAGSPSRDQLSERKSLAGETREEALSTQERYKHSPDTAAAAAQMDVFGSPRRQKRAASP